MLELEKNSSKSTSVDDTSHSFTPTSNVRNGFRRKKGDTPFTYNLNLKVKKEKKQSNCTNPDPWARIVGSRNTAAIYMNGVATTAFAKSLFLKLCKLLFTGFLVASHPECAVFFGEMVVRGCARRDLC